MSSMTSGTGATGLRPDQSALGFFVGGGDMGRRLRTLDWRETPFGEPEGWPQSLRSAVSICLNTQFPIAIYWGASLALIYNDAWSEIPGEKHPAALGRPGREVWPEIWDVIGPLFERVQRTGEGVWLQDQLLPMHRHGYTEECYFNFTFSPIRGEDGRVAGIFNAVVETTFNVIEERRARQQQALSEALVNSRSIADVCSNAAEALSQAATDVPFALFYLLEGAGRAQLAARTTGPLPARLSPVIIDMQQPDAVWRPAAVTGIDELQVTEALEQRAGAPIRADAWPEPIERAVLLPLGSPQTPVGFVVAAVSPRRALDAAYRSYFNRIAARVSAAIQEASLHEAARLRAESLAELDRAKTAFFANVSHEFRTPLTLLLGPVAEAAANPETPAPVRAQLELAHRNALRLLRLVNSLLDFSRLEAGRAQATYEPTDLSALTRDLASNFRSAIERAGLRFTVDCPPLDEPIYVDRDMWEKIVLNLLSNAFKFTFSGEISVVLRREAAQVVLCVSDTGSGIPPAQLPRLFERFHRVEGAAGRTQEGSGIGLALVQELVKLHAGSIEVSSQLGKGSTFRVLMPMGSAHLAAERIKHQGTQPHSPAGAQVFVQEALRWLPDADGGSTAELVTLSEPSNLRADQRFAATFGARIVLADDNADMRSYVCGVLAPYYTVETVADGEAALQAVRRKPPQLVLSDVMMPRLDGFGLLRALRQDPALGSIPIVLLSARAGGEARIEGLDAGADDYLIKPFSARELLARVGALLELTRLRGEHEARLRLALSSIRDQFYMLDANWRYTLVNPRVLETTGRSEAELLGRSIYELFPDLKGSRVARELAIAAQGQRPRRFEHETEQQCFEYTLYPAGDGIAVLVTDISERKHAERLLEARSSELRQTLETSATGLTRVNKDLTYISANSAYAKLAGLPRERIVGHTMQEVLGPAALASVHPYIDRVLRGETVEYETQLHWAAAGPAWIHAIYTPWREADGTITGWVASINDITLSKQAQIALAEREEQLRLATDAAEVALWDVDVANDTLYWPARVKAMFGISPEVPVSMADFYAGVHPLDRQRVSEAFAAALDPERRAVYDVEYRTVGKEDGLIRWVAAKGRGTFDDQGRCVRVIGTAVDTTARKRIEALLRDREQALAHEAEALAQLNEWSCQLWRQRDLRQGIEAMLDAAIELLGADKGNVQLLGAVQILRIEAQRGFD